METVTWIRADYEAFARKYAEQKADLIIEALGSGKNVLCPSFAGSGKSYAVDVVLSKMNLVKGQYVRTAFTGVAAIAIGGRTLNSTFRFPLVSNKKIGSDESAEEYIERVAKIWASSVRSRRSHAEVKSLMSTLKVVVNDEVSMTSGLMLKIMDRSFQLFYRNDLPFGGLQMILLGDWAQLLCYDELSRDVPDSCHLLLQGFERVMFDFGHRYMLRQDGAVVEQRGFVRFLDQLRFGSMMLPDFQQVGFRVLTESEYKERLPDIAMMLMAHTNGKVDAWNRDIAQIYRARTTVVDWSFEPVELSALQKPGFAPLSMTQPGAEAIVATALASGLVDPVEDGSMPRVFVRDIDDHESRRLPTLLNGLSGETPIELPSSLELLPRVRNAALRVVRLVNATEAERLVDLTEEQELLANPYSLASPGRQIDGYERRQREAYAELLKAR
jgi:hypothetical protein